MSKEIEFEVLGFKLRYKPEDGESEQSAMNVVDMVRKEASKISAGQKNLEGGQMAILLSLKFASDYCKLNEEYKENVSKMKATASDALEIIESSFNNPTN